MDPLMYLLHIVGNTIIFLDNKTKEEKINNVYRLQQQILDLEAMGCGKC